ncbi:hypothetical protein IWX91DRAFT_337761, partial [Phyllosticta citricarpa]
MRALSGGKSRLIKRLVLGLTLLFLESVLLGQKAFQKVRRAGFESTRRRAPTTGGHGRLAGLLYKGLVHTVRDGIAVRVARLRSGNGSMSVITKRVERSPLYWRSCIHDDLDDKA